MRVFMRFVSVILFSVSLLFAQTTLDDALKLFKQEKYEMAFDAFLELVENDLTSTELNLHLARTAFKIKKYSEAIAAYERILINHPNHNLAKLELARSYFLLKRYTLSSQLFNEVLKNNPPLQVKINISNYLKEIKNKDKLSSLTGLIQIGANYDSNINGASNADTFYVPALGATFTNTSLDTHDWSHQEVVVLHHKLDTTKLWGFAIKNDFTIYSKNLQNFTDYNILYLSYAPTLAWQFDKLTVDFGISRDSMWYGGEYFLENYAPFTKLNYKTESQSNYMLLFKSITKTYQQDSFKTRNAKQQELTLSYQTRLGKRTSLFLREVIQLERKISGTDANVDYNSYDTSLGFTYILNPRWRLNTLLGYKNLKYLDKDAFFQQKHVQNRYTLKLGVTSLLTQSLSLDSSILGLQNDSTIETTNYERFAFAMNLIKKF